MLVPAGGSRCWRFSAEGFDLLDASDVQAIPASSREGGQGEGVMTGAGLPVTSAVDMDTGWAAVAYERGFAVANLALGRVQWFPCEWTRPPRAISVRDGLASMVSQDEVALYRLADGKRLDRKLSVGQWLEDCGLEEIRFTCPLSSRELVLVGSRRMRLLSPPSLWIQKVDLSVGLPETRLKVPIEAFTRLEGCSYSGKAVYLAGILEEDMRLAGQRSRLGDLRQTLRVVRVDPETLEQRTIVSMERQDFETSVETIAVGSKAVAILLSSGELEVFKLLADETATQPIRPARLVPGASLTWLDGNRLAVTSGTGIRLLECFAESP
jgi:hypothetical protein